MDYAALKTYILTDPDALGLAAHVAKGSDGMIAALLNTKRVASRREIEPRELFKTLTERGLWAKLIRLSEDTAQQNQARADAALLLTDLAYPPSGASINLDAASVADALNTLQASVDLLVADSAAILALGDTAVSVMEKKFGAGVNVTHIDVARALRGGGE